MTRPHRSPNFDTLLGFLESTKTSPSLFELMLVGFSKPTLEARRFWRVDHIIYGLQNLFGYLAQTQRRSFFVTIVVVAIWCLVND